MQCYSLGFTYDAGDHLLYAVFFGIDCGFIFDCDLQIVGFSPLICYDTYKSCEPKMNSSSETIKYIVSFSL